MQRQKTIAKWLAIVLLCTVAVGAYIMYDALYVGDGGQASAGGGTEGMPDPEPLPEPDPPYYTELPRQPETVNGAVVRHAGGEKDDLLQSAVFTQEGALAFFRSQSDEFDCRGRGLYCAVFDGSGLSAVNAFSDGADDNVLAAKRTAAGITVIASGKSGSKIYLFDEKGKVAAERDFPFCESAYIHTGAQTSVFFSDGESLRHASIDTGLQIETDAFVKYADGCEIVQTVALGENHLIVAQCGGDVEIFSFSQKNGFETLNTLTETEYLQFAPLTGEEGVLFALLGRTRGGLLLSTFGADGRTRDSALLPDRSSAAVFGDGTSLTLVCEGVTETYCRHLDRITSVNNALAFGRVYFARNYGGDGIFAADCEGELTLYRVSAEGGTETLFSQPDSSPQYLAFAAGGGKMSLAFSSSSAEKHCYQNFGGSDVFLFSVNAA